MINRIDDNSAHRQLRSYVCLSLYRIALPSHHRGVVLGQKVISTMRF